MEKERVLNFLNKYNYIYSEKTNKVFVTLELSQQVIIEFEGENKIIIKDKLVGWNFLTGIFEMSLKNAMIYNFVGIIAFGTLSLISTNRDNSLNYAPFLFVFSTWILLFSGFYTTKLESFKNQLVNWTKD